MNYMSSNKIINMCFISLFLIALMIYEPSEASNILVLFPVPSKSHHYMFQPVIKELANRGHNVTIISPYSLSTNLTNLHEHIVHSSGEDFIDTLTFEDVLNLRYLPLFRMCYWFYGLMITEDYLKDDVIQKLIHSTDDQFDLVILETSFGQESLMGFSHKFKAPVITFNSFVNFFYLNEFIGNPFSLSYIPNIELSFSNKMSFFERVINTIRTIITVISGYVSYLPEHEALMRKYFNYSDSENIPPLVDLLKYNIRLAIVNSHISVDYAQPLVPNIVNAAGLHIKNKTKPLPQDLQEFMDKSVNGVIYFSLGTIVPVHRMPLELKQEFFKAFSKLKQNILWKANTDFMENLPKNVKVVKWVPQQSILAHPNCIGFMTHGGLLSQQEAIYFAQPMVGIPVFCDQPANIARAEAKGFGLKLELHNLTAESIFWAVNEIITNTKYRETAKRYSNIFRDNPLTPLENSVYWIEYVLRHKGAQHLQSSQLDISYPQYLLLDVISFLIGVIVLFFLISYLILKCLFIHLLKKRNVKFDTNKKNS